MDWSRTKTIFIITFLLLNTFLTYQIIDKRNNSNLNVRAQDSVEKTLSDRNITVTDELPEEREEISHIVGQPANIEENVKSKVGEENVSPLDNSFVEVTLDDPYSVSNEEDISNFFDQHIWNAEEYDYDEWDNEAGQMYFNQTYEDDTVVTYEEDQLVLFLNEDNEVESYIQSYLEFEKEGKKKDMLAPYRAIEMLLNEGILSFNDEVNEVEVGYYSLFQPEGTAQVLAPMYRIEVNGENEYLVNAIDGSIRTLQEVSEKTDEAGIEDQNQDQDKSEDETEEDE